MEKPEDLVDILRDVVINLELLEGFLRRALQQSKEFVGILGVSPIFAFLGPTHRHLRCQENVHCNAIVGQAEITFLCLRLRGQLQAQAHSRWAASPIRHNSHPVGIFPQRKTTYTSLLVQAYALYIYATKARSVHGLLILVVGHAVKLFHHLVSLARDVLVKCVILSLVNSADFLRL